MSIINSMSVPLMAVMVMCSALVLGAHAQLRQGVYWNPNQQAASNYNPYGYYSAYPQPAAYGSLGITVVSGLLTFFIVAGIIVGLLWCCCLGCCCGPAANREHRRRHKRARRREESDSDSD